MNKLYIWQEIGNNKDQNERLPAGFHICHLLYLTFSLRAGRHEKKTPKSKPKNQTKTMERRTWILFLPSMQNLSIISLQLVYYISLEKFFLKLISFCTLWHFCVTKIRIWKNSKLVFTDYHQNRFIVGKDELTRWTITLRAGVKTHSSHLELIR